MLINFWVIVARCISWIFTGGGGRPLLCQFKGTYYNELIIKIIRNGSHFQSCSSVQLINVNSPSFSFPLSLSLHLFPLDIKWKHILMKNEEEGRTESDSHSVTDSDSSVIAPEEANSSAPTSYTILIPPDHGAAPCNRSLLFDRTRFNSFSFPAPMSIPQARTGQKMVISHSFSVYKEHKQQVNYLLFISSGLVG